MNYRILTLCLSACLALSPFQPASAQDEILPETQTVALDPTEADRTDFGELIFKGGLSIETGDEEIGGLSGLEWHEDRLYAVSDDGRWFTITPDEIDGRLIDIYSMETGPLLDLRGKRIRRREDGDAEAITRSHDGAWLVAFERDHRVWRYDNLQATPTATPTTINPQVTGDRANKGIEAMAALDQSLLICEEYVGEAAPNCRFEAAGEAEFFEVSANIGEYQPVPTDAACIYGEEGDPSCYVLLRSYTPGLGNHIAIVALPPDEEPKLLASFAPPLALDNFEGLAIRQQYGKTYLYIVSDDNFSRNQRTLLMKFEVKQEAAPAQPAIVQTPEPVVDYETADVVLETALGDITIRLETERAPITAANFLRYVDEDRFDGTTFYRAMKLDREPQPNGLIQAGARFDPARILPGIPHEPTTQTGLSHTNGALSMAMGEPGTANGDFSIMLQDQIGLDARPEAEEAVWQNGYAVFGYVIDGMDVVYAIHAAPTDPDAGQGAMRGQMIANPVEIIDARRAETSEEEAAE